MQDRKFNFSVDNIQPFSPSLNQQQLPPLSDEEIVFNALKDCLNYILAKETITDFFPLINQDTMDVFVDLKELLNISLVGNITSDINLVIKALKENKKFYVDEEHQILKVNQSDRTTIILRDMHEDTPEEEIKKLFGDFASHIVSMQPEIGDNYYVNFDTTEVTQNAFNHVRTQTYNGKTVGCCITNFTPNYNYPHVYIPPEQENPYKNYNDYKDGKKKFNKRRKDYRKVGGGPTSNGRGGSRSTRGKKRDYQSEQIQDIGEYWPPLPVNPLSPKEQKFSDIKKYDTEQIVVVIDGLKDIKPPVWNVECSIISDKINSDIEIGKVLPSSYKTEWVEKVKGNRKKNHRGRSSSGKRDESQITNNKNNENLQSVPVWPGRNHKQKKEYVVKKTHEEAPEQTQENQTTDTPKDTPNTPQTDEQNSVTTH